MPAQNSGWAGLSRWLQVAFAPPAPLWRAEEAGAALISASDALKAGAAVFLVAHRPAVPPSQLAHPIIIDVCCVSAGVHL